MSAFRGARPSEPLLQNAAANGGDIPETCKNAARRDLLNCPIQGRQRHLQSRFSFAPQCRGVKAAEGPARCAGSSLAFPSVAPPTSVVTFLPSPCNASSYVIRSHQESSHP